MNKPFVFYVSGITCTSCTNLIHNYLTSQLSPTFEIELFHADLTSGSEQKPITILLRHYDSAHYDELHSALKNHIEALGFVCDPKSSEQDSSNKLNPLQSLQKKLVQFSSSHWLLGILGCVSGITVLILCLIGIPYIGMVAIGIISSFITIVLGYSSYKNTFLRWSKTLFSGMDSLIVLSTTITLGVSLLALLIPSLPMMFDAGLLIFGFRHLGVAIENTVKKKIEPIKFSDRAPRILTKRHNNLLTKISIEEINIGDIIYIEPGELIPIDGYCDSDTVLYTTIIDGSDLPKTHLAQKPIVAGMRLADNAQPIELICSKNHEQSYLNQLDIRIKTGLTNKAPLQIQTEKILIYFFPAVILLALILGVSVALFIGPGLALQCAISILVGACPCTLGLITPLAIKTGMHKAFENGVQFKDAQALQQAEQIDTIIFDLNGTLTLGSPSIKEVCPRNCTHQELLLVCKLLEQKSMHPIGLAIAVLAKKYIFSESVTAQNVDQSHHGGISAEIKNHSYCIGSVALMNHKKIAIPPDLRSLEMKAGEHLVYVAKNKDIIGYIIITDPLRDDAIPVISSLNQMNKNIHLCTGADFQTAERYAKLLGIKHINAECTPESKAKYIADLKNKNHKVAMVGDAANDTEAIIMSDFGIAITSDNGDKVTQNAAHAIIRNNTLLPIISTFSTSQQTVSNIRQNLWISLCYNICSLCLLGLIVAAGITLNPALAVLLMTTQACLVLLNVYRFKKQALPTVKKIDQHSSSLLPNQNFIINDNSNTIAKQPFHKKETSLGFWKPMPDEITITKSIKTQAPVM